MHILIKTLTGKTCSLNFEKTASIDNVYSQVEKVMGVPTEEQNLIFKGKCLEYGKLLLDYEMSEEENVYLVIEPAPFDALDLELLFWNRPTARSSIDPDYTVALSSPNKSSSSICKLRALIAAEPIAYPVDGKDIGP